MVDLGCDGKSKLFLTLFCAEKEKLQSTRFVVWLNCSLKKRSE